SLVAPMGFTGEVLDWFTGEVVSASPVRFTEASPWGSGAATIGSRRDPLGGSTGHTNDGRSASPGSDCSGSASASSTSISDGAGEPSPSRHGSALLIPS